MDPEKAADVLATMEAKPTVTREMLMRRIAEAWLEGQRRAHPRPQVGDSPSKEPW